MKTKSPIVLMMLLLFSGCVASVGFSQKKETRKTDSFTRVGMAVAGDLYISQGDQFEVVIEGPENLLEDIVTKVEGDLLKIKYRNWGPHRNSVHVYITMPEIEGLAVSGSGNIMNKTPIQSDDLSLAVSGSGNIRLNNITSDEIGARISGSGNIELSGESTSEHLDAAISGSGSIRCGALPAEEVNVKISGSGNAYVFADKKLSVSLAGSGNVKYKGKPVVDARVAGSGKVRSVN